MMNLLINTAQLLIFILAAPLLRGVISKLKARIQKRQGASKHHLSNNSYHSILPVEDGFLLGPFVIERSPG